MKKRVIKELLNGQRDKDKISSREASHHFITTAQPIHPVELNKYEHLVINTTRQGSAATNAEKIKKYLLRKS